MRILVSIVMLMALICASGCIHDSNAGQNSNISYTVESNGRQVGIQDQQFHVITTDAQYSSLLSSVTLTGTIPSINFSNLSLASVFLGNQIGCLGDALSVTSVIETEKTITINVARTIGSPPPDMACTAMVPAGGPYVLVSIPKSTKLISLHIE